MPADFYDLLDVDEDASQEEVRTAYRRLAREYHPDVNPDERANHQFQAVKQAHDVLSDPAERAAYDRMGHAHYVHERLDGLPGVETPRPPESTGTDDDGDDSEAEASSTRREPAAARRAREVASRRRERLSRLRWYLAAGVLGYLLGVAWLLGGRPATAALLASLSATPASALAAPFPAVGVFAGTVTGPLDLLFPLGAVAVAVGGGVVVREFERLGARLAFVGTLAPLGVVVAALAGTTLPAGAVLGAVAAALLGGVALLVAVEQSRR